MTLAPRDATYITDPSDVTAIGPGSSNIALVPYPFAIPFFKGDPTIERVVPDKSTSRTTEFILSPMYRLPAASASIPATLLKYAPGPVDST
jgi:hypothetical protein